MKSKYSACSAVMLLLSMLWTLPASAQSFEIGVWYSPKPGGGSVWLAFSGTNMVSVNTDANFLCGGGVLAGYADTYDVIDDIVSGTTDVRCKGVAKFNFDFELTYGLGGDDLTGLFLLFRRVNNADPDAFIEFVRKWKSNLSAEWETLSLLMNAPPVLAPLPGQGADCTNPPKLVPGADLTNCDLAGTDLTGADLTGADLSGANLSGAIFAGTILTDADLTGADLFSADINSAIWGNTTCPDTTNSDVNDGDGFTCNFNLSSEPPCVPDAFELNETGFEAYDLGTLTDTAGGGGGNQDGITGAFCNGGNLVQYVRYPIFNPPNDPLLDHSDDSSEYFFEVVRIPGQPQSCDSYSVNVSNGPVGFEQFVNVTGNIATEGDHDWYRFQAADDREGTAALDSWRVNIELTSGFGQFSLRVFRNGLSATDNECLINGP